jgi:hypothetical protein
MVPVCPKACIIMVMGLWCRLSQTILVQVQLARDDNTPWSNWIDEFAIVRQSSPSIPYLFSDDAKLSSLPLR